MENRKAERFQKMLPILAAIASFWAIALFWNAFVGVMANLGYTDWKTLEMIPRLGFGAALSWVAFAHVEGVGYMILMSMERDRMRAEARAEEDRKATQEMLGGILQEMVNDRAEREKERAEAAREREEARAEAARERAERERERAEDRALILNMLQILTEKEAS